MDHPEDKHDISADGSALLECGIGAYENSGGKGGELSELEDGNDFKPMRYTRRGSEEPQNDADKSNPELNVDCIDEY